MAVPAPRSLRFALLVSLALNLLLAAALAVVWLDPQRSADPIGVGPIRVPHAEKLLRVLPDADRPIAGEIVEKHRSGIRAQLPPLHAARRELRDAFNADPPDPARIDAALKEVRKNLRQDAESLVFWTKLANIALMPLLVALLGLGFFLYRRRTAG